MDRSKDLLEYVAPEIWAMIFEKVQYCQRSKDTENFRISNIYSCYLVCCKFSDILESNKRLWLFREILPTIAPYLKISEILNCRRICKSWKRSIDHYLENEGYALGEPQPFRTKSQRRRLPLGFLRNSFTSSARINSFLEIMNNHTGNPFPLRTLYISYDPKTNEDMPPLQHNIFWNQDVPKLLTRFGNSLDALHLKCPFSNPTTNWTFSLNLTKNLKRLFLEAEAYHYVPRSNQVLPPLPRLDTLRFDPGAWPFMLNHYSSTIPAPVQYHLCCPLEQRLKRLQICLADRHGPTAKLFPLFLPNLEDLEVTVSSASQLYTVFPSGGCHSKGVRRLVIRLGEFDTTSVQNPFHLGDFLRPLDKLGGCLKQLAITADDSVFMIVSEKDINCMESLQCLQQLHIEGFWFGNTSILTKLPKTLQSLRVTGIKRNKWQLADVKYISVDLPNEDTILDGTTLRCTMPNLKELSVRDYYSKELYVYQRDINLQWQIRLKEQQDANNLGWCSNLDLGTIAIGLFGLLFTCMITFSFVVLILELNAKSKRGFDWSTGLIFSSEEEIKSYREQQG